MKFGSLVLVVGNLRGERGGFKKRESIWLVEVVCSETFLLGGRREIWKIDFLWTLG